MSEGIELPAYITYSSHPPKGSRCMKTVHWKWFVLHNNSHTALRNCLGKYLSAWTKTGEKSQSEEERFYLDI